jgi:RNA polymerase sigma-70 factor (ECF subfamily)
MEVVAAKADPETSTELTTSDFVECYLMHYRRLVNALRLAGADQATAEDISQEAFSRALTRWRRVSRGPNPPGYVYVTGFRLFRRHARRSARWKLGDVDADVQATLSSGVWTTEEAATTSVAIESVLERMPPKRRACAVMCLLAGMSVSEAGEALGIVDGTVRKHIEAARSDLAQVRS